ncbi:MAG: MBOAT family protein [Paludibacteraceae bacterium]|nr:MBOAT family protein [Paludibacteraceae bacterium]
MLATILINYFGALAVDKYRTKKIYAVSVTIVCDLLFLFYFKYFDFFISNINEAFHSNFGLLNILMPIGISFYTFQSISYVVDVYRDEVPVQKNLYKLALYISLFPQLVAGPIVKYHDVAEQIENRQVDYEAIVSGIKRFIVGLSKKVLIANTMGAIADNIFSKSVDELSVAVSWLGTVTYSLQIFFDFSGYSDMAIGLGLMFGFKFKENFNYPYISKSITEFWRRWHISLSTWFKEYVYIPLGGNRISQKRTYINIAIVFLLTGFWHGANWTFMLWGVWHGLFNIIEKATGIFKDSGVRWKEGVKHVYALLVVLFGWVLFRADNITYAWAYIRNMIGFYDSSSYLMFNSYVTIFDLFILVLAIVFSTPIASNFLNISSENFWKNKFQNVSLIILFVISVSFLVASTYNPFIYFRF